MPPRTLVFSIYYLCNHIYTRFQKYLAFKNCLPQEKSILFTPNFKQQYKNFARMHKLLILIISGLKTRHSYVTACYICYICYIDLCKKIVSLSIVNISYLPKDKTVAKHNANNYSLIIIAKSGNGCMLHTLQ